MVWTERTGGPLNRAHSMVVGLGVLLGCSSEPPHWQTLPVQLVEAEQLRQSLLRSSATPEMQRVMLLRSMPLDSAQAYRALVTALGDEAVVVRLAAVEMAAGLDIRWRQEYLSPLLRDEIKSVRLAATLALVPSRTDTPQNERTLRPRTATDMAHRGSPSALPVARRACAVR